jgi:hypothetical protein
MALTTTHPEDTAMPYIRLVDTTAMPYRRTVQTVIETQSYLAASNAAGMTDEERESIVDALAREPEAGAIMPGTGGCRKLRWKKPGTGKSGGYRIITYYGGDEVPVFLLTTFGKNEKANLTKNERNALAKLTSTLSDSLMRKKNEERIRQDRRRSR